MSLKCSHIVINTSDITKSRDFYINKLGFELLEEYPHFFAFRAWDVRFSVFKGGSRLDIASDKPPNIKIIFRVEDVEDTVRKLKEKGVEFAGKIAEAPGFMKHIELLDPDNNLLYIGQYLRDPLKPYP